MQEPAPAIDLSECEREPIRTPGRVQSHGILFVLDVRDGHICQQSPAARAINSSTLWTALWPYLDQQLDGEEPRVLPLPLLISGTRYHVRVHRRQNRLLVELELPRPQAHHYDLTPIVRRLERCTTPEEYIHRVTVELQRLTYYDRVMLYRFDADFHGQVIAESSSGQLHSYLGQHFPASDIPAQAREMYREVRLRLLVDVNAVSSPVEPSLDPDTGLSLDMSRVLSREVSPIHCEYLRNMGVAATLVLSLVQDGQLWGLIACHQVQPRYLTFHQCQQLELFVEAVSMQLRGLLDRAAVRERELVRQRGLHMSAQFQPGQPLEVFYAQLAPELLELAQSDGLIRWQQRCIFAHGRVLERDAIERLMGHLRRLLPSTEIYHTDRLPQVCPELDPYADIASGVLAIRLANGPDEWLIWLRGEQVITMNWAGHPDKSVQLNTADGRLHPRASFALWKQEIRQRSVPWSPALVEAIRQFYRDFLAVRAIPSERGYRFLLSNVDIGILLLNQKSQIVDANLPAAQLLGQPIEALLQRSCDDLCRVAVHEDGSPVVHESHPVVLAFSRREPVRKVVMGISRPDQAERLWLLVSAFPHLNEQGEVETVLCSLVDITEYHRNSMG